MTVTVDLTATGLCIPAEGEKMSDPRPNYARWDQPDYDKVSGVEDAKQTLSDWEWSDGGDTLFKKLSISAAGVVIDEMERSFEVLFCAGDPPELAIWPIGLDNPEFTVSLARLVDEFINTDIENIDEEDAAAFSKWLRASADRVDANIYRSFRAGEK